MALSSIECSVMQWDGNNPKENWRRFKHDVVLMLRDLLNPDQKRKNAAIYSSRSVRKEGVSTTYGLTFPMMTKKLGTYFEHFESYVSPKANHVFARFKFHSRAQESSETAEKFITAIRILAQDCDFKDPEEMIRD